MFRVTPGWILRSVVLVGILATLGGPSAFSQSGGSEQLAWKELILGLSPPSRFAAAMAPAPEMKGGGVLLYGGCADDVTGTALEDTWYYDGIVWQKLDHTGPGPRYGHRMARLPSGKVLLFGGLQGEQFLGDTWIHDGQGWSQVVGQGPSPRAFHGMARSPEAGGVVLFGGAVDSDDWQLSDETWIFREETGWVRLSIPGPEARWRHAMAYSAYEDHDLVGVILFGGDQSLRGIGPAGDTWWFHRDEEKLCWSQVQLDDHPASRYGHAMAEFQYASIKKHVAMLFGGRTEGQIFLIPGAKEYRLWEFNTWGLLQPDPMPCWRLDTSMAWDEASYSIVLFGGLDPKSGPRGDTWIFSEQ